ncbi:MAG: MFS transporter [Bacteroidales bacterium]|nr:MFS transporter [Bacteroidales bacterium]MBQ7772390.1 MFS transporter [Bacteroidales bacterium]MBQ8812569.1 MFS transporter [Bacteroidales bacterium]
MGLYSFYRISKPSDGKVSPEKVDSTYKMLRNRTFWGATIAYSLYYVCRMSINVVKQPLIDEGVLSAGQLGLIGSALLFVYAVGKFMNGFIADYCNIRRFMATGLFVSAVVNLILGALGLFQNMIPSVVIFVSFAVLWGINGWMQSMGSAPGVISLSRWFPQVKRGTYYSLFSTSPYIGEFISYNVLALVVGWAGWQYGFIMAAAAGLVGAALILIFVSDTPESKGLPSIQEISGEELTRHDRMSTRDLQKMILKHPGLWVIALSSAFIYITKYAIAGWGVLFLQKARGFGLAEASQVIAFSAISGVLGTVLAGWLSDRVFKGDRVKPAVLSGIISTSSLILFLFVGGGFVLNIFYVSLFSLSVGVLYCIVAGLMAVDIVPRKATGAALGVVGISSYIAAGIQDITSGYLIQGFVTEVDGTDIYDFGPVSWFWVVAAIVSFVLPVLNWKKMKG